MYQRFLFFLRFSLLLGLGYAQGMKLIDLENRASQSNHNGISSITSDDQWFTLPEQTAILPLENSNAWKLKSSFGCKRQIFRGFLLFVFMECDIAMEDHHAGCYRHVSFSILKSSTPKKSKMTMEHPAI